MDTGLLVDPTVSRVKFEREVAEYRRLQDQYIRRGWWLITAEYPEVFVVFGNPQLAPPGVMFGAVLDFTNYDLWPPSVRLVDPFTREPYLAAHLPPPARLARRVPAAAAPQPNGGGGTNAAEGAPQFAVQTMMQAHAADAVPFLCMIGVREYHHHPRHSGDLWLLYRRSGRGRLASILEALWSYGVVPVKSFQFQIQIGYEQELPE